MWAVGYVQRGDVRSTLVEHWDGTSWTRVPSVNPDAKINRLLGVTALAPDDVWAVGTTDGGARSFILHRDVTGWSQVAAPSRGAASTLYGVSALSDDDAWAVGTSSTTGARTTVLVEHWDGQDWTIVD